MNGSPCKPERERFWRALWAYYPQLLGTARRSMPGDDPGDVEDVVQQTYVGAWRHRQLYRGECSLRSWLYSILWRRIADYRRQRWRQSRVQVALGLAAFSEAERAAAVDADEGPLLPVSRMDISEVVEGRELSAQVWTVLSGLAPEYRDVLTERMDGWTVRQIAQHWGQSEQSVEYLVARAKASFMEAWREKYGSASSAYVGVNVGRGAAELRDHPPAKP
jgi:RNA polymerase sigma factor (sigma-70 family)